MTVCQRLLANTCSLLRREGRWFGNDEGCDPAMVMEYFANKEKLY